MKKKILFTAIGALMSVQVSASTVSHDLGEQANKANLVFKGTVVSVDYRESKGQSAQGAVPHTFVTYEIQDVLFGNANRKKFTLRFMGGKNKRGDIMMVSESPKFDVGDEDIIFVDGNGVSECPLIGCTDGRYRIINGQVYTEYGQPVMQDDQGTMFNGPSEDLHEVTHFMIGDREFRRIKHRSDDYEGDGSEVQQPRAKGHHLDAQGFINSLAEKVAKAIPDDPRGSKRNVNSQDINRPFTIASSKAVSLPDPVFDVVEPKPQTEQEKREVEAMKKNGGNPVIE